MADRWGRFSYPHGPSPTEESLKMQVKAVINIEKCSLSTIPILSVFNSALFFQNETLRRQNMLPNTKRREGYMHPKTALPFW